MLEYKLNRSSLTRIYWNESVWQTDWIFWVANQSTLHTRALKVSSPWHCAVYCYVILQWSYVDLLRVIFVHFYRVVILTSMPSVLWRCWLGGRKGIRPVKSSSGGVLVWLSVRSEVETCIWPSWCHCHSLSLASVKSRLVLPFWYRLTWVVPQKGPLNGCVCVILTSIDEIIK